MAPSLAHRARPFTYQGLPAGAPRLTIAAGRPRRAGTGEDIVNRRAEPARLAAILFVVAALGGVLACSPLPTPTPGQTTPVTYGPYNIPATTPTEMGMIHNGIAVAVAKPCTDCFVTGIQARLTNPDGTTANVDTGLWLHHMVLGNFNKVDTTCPNTGPGRLGERFWASGNERARFAAPPGYGYPVGASDMWNMIYELMNMNAVVKTVSIEVTYNWVPATTPGMKPLTPVWLDIDQCGDSEVPAGTGQYHFDYTWQPVTVPGKVLLTYGHLHDGGTNLQLLHNGVQVCDSVAGYGGPGYVDGGMDHGTDHDMDHGGGTAHLSSMSACWGLPVAPVATLAAGDSLSIRANYDANAHPQMGHEEVMGITFVYIDPS
jgi:hypothetical protein